MLYSSSEIAEIIDADLVYAGTGSTIIKRGAYFEDAREDELTYAVKTKVLKHLSISKAGAVIVPTGTTLAHSDLLENGSFKPAIIESGRPKQDFFKALSLFYPQKPSSPEPFIAKDAVIGGDCRIEQGVCIHANVTIGDQTVIKTGAVLMPGVYVGNKAYIGKKTLVKANVTILDNTVIGNSCLIHPGSVIGSDDFDFSFRGGATKKMPCDAGYVEIGDHVEIGANNAIARGSIGRTVIEDGVKTDNLVHISHNVIIRKDAFILAQTCIAGRTTIGKGAILGAQVAVSGGLEIGDYAVVGATASVGKNVKSGETVSAFYPAMPHRLNLKVAATLPAIAKMRKTLLRLEKNMARFNGSHENHVLE